jgi:integrase
MTAKRTRANGEGSIYPYKGGFAAYAWVDTPDGKRKRKYVYGQTRDEVHDKWIKLHAAAQKGPVATKTPLLGDFLDEWLSDVVKPNSAPLTYVTHESAVRLYISPHLGKKPLNKLSTKLAREWLTKLVNTCQCCAQGKDEARRADRRRCCALGKCCESYTGRRTLETVRATLRAALNHAIREELISRNVAALVDVPRARRRTTRRKVRPWSVDEARRFLEHTRRADDPLYAAWVLFLVLGLRRGEVLGLTWDAVDLERAELRTVDQLQRAGGELLHRETKTEDSDDILPLPPIVVAALRLRKRQQANAKAEAADAWHNALNLVFTTKYGTPYEPSNITNRFPPRCTNAGVREIHLHDTRHTVASMLVALDVHPRVAMKILRHSQIAVTMEIYSHPTDEQIRDALNKLGKLFG